MKLSYFNRFQEWETGSWKKYNFIYYSPVVRSWFLGERGFGVPTKFYCGLYIFEYPIGAGLAPLSILRNMLIKAAITEISFSSHNYLNCQDTWEIFVSTPRFWGSLILIRPWLTRFGYLHMHYMLIRVVIIINLIFCGNSVTQSGKLMIMVSTPRF